MRHLVFGLAALAGLSSCAPYASTYGYGYQTGPAAEPYAAQAYAPDYAPEYAPQYAPGYAAPYYAAPGGYYAAPPVIIGRDYGRRPEFRPDYRRDGFRPEPGRNEFGRNEPFRFRPEQTRPFAGGQPAPAQPRPFAASQPAFQPRPQSPIPPPPSGGQAFTDWSNRHINNSPGPAEAGR